VAVLAAPSIGTLAYSDVADRQQDAAVGQGGGVVPVPADPAGPLGRQVSHRHPEAGQVDRRVRDRQDDVLQLGGQLVFGGEVALVFAELLLHLGELDAGGLAGRHVLHDPVDLQRPPGGVAHRVGHRPQVLDPAPDADAERDVGGLAAFERLRRLYP
jgi:hypothetical protein